MDSLFAPDPQFRQSQWQKISNNTQEWEQQILATLADVVSSKDNLASKISWKKIDEDNGYGIGTIVLGKKSGMSIGVPIVIRNWHLAPLDIVLIDDKAYPLTKDTLGEIFLGTGLATELVSKKPSPLSTAAHSSSLRAPGKMVYASDCSMLTSISGSLKAEDVEAMLKIAHGEPNIVAAMEQRGTLGLLSKIAKEDTKKKDKKKAPAKIIHAKKNGVNKFKIMATNDEVFDPVMTEVDRRSMRYLAKTVSGTSDKAREIMAGIDKNQEKIIKAPKVENKESKGKHGPQGNVFLSTDEDNKAVKADKYGVYKVRDNAGIASVGVVFPNVIDLDKKSVGLKIFAGKGLCAIQPSISAVPQDGAEVSLPETEPSSGKFGTFVMARDGKALATVPFKIKVMTDHEGRNGYSIVDIRGKESVIIPSYYEKDIVKMKKRKGEPMPMLRSPGKGETYMIPREMKFVELGDMRKITADEDEYKKIAAAHDAMADVTIQRLGDSFVFDGNLGKYASSGLDFQNLDKDEASFVLAAFGCPQEKIAQVMQDTKLPQKVSVHGLDMPKSAEENSAAEELLNEYINSLKTPMLKQAAVFDEGETVDTVLSLGFVNQDNINKFISAIPILKRTLSSLSKMLLAARMGMKNIPEEAAQSSIQNILKIISGLKKLGLMKPKG